MSATNLSKVVAAKRARLKVLEQLPSSPTRDQELLAVSSELRKLYKLVSDRMNAIPWNEEKKQLRDLREELDRAPIWGYELDVNLSTKRLNELDTELTAGGLNNSIRKKLQKERRTISALRRRTAEHAMAASASESTSPASKSLAEKIAEYKADVARALRSGTNEG
jgi:hypothetical protein